MTFYDFCTLVDEFIVPRAEDFKKCIAAQVSFLKIRPKQYDDLFNFSEYPTGLDWGISLTNLIKMFRKGEGDLYKATAFYYLFHQKEPFFPAAKNIDFFLFGEGVPFENKFNGEEHGFLPSSEKAASEKSKGDRRGQNKIANDGNNSPTEILLKILDRLTGESKMMDLLLRLDWSEKDGAFRFDPQKGPNKADEPLLDRLLYYISLAGGVIRRGEVGLRDVGVLRSWILIVMGNKDVHAYIKWLHREDQLPDHADFLDAIFLYELLSGQKIPTLTDYSKRAEQVLARLETE